VATIADIAEAAGVSRGTVDRVLHNRGKVSAKNAERIRAAITNLDYKPNIFARGLSLSKVLRFGVLIPESRADMSYFSLPAQGIEKAQKELIGYQVKIDYYYYDYFSDMQEQKVCQQLLDSIDRLDGLIIVPALSRLAENFVRQIPPGFPYVFIDTHLPDTHCLSSIRTSPRQSGKLAARLMDMLIHQPGTVAVIRGLPENFLINDRVCGFREYFEGNPRIKTEVFDADRTLDRTIFAIITRKIVSGIGDLRGIFVPSSTTHLVAETLDELKVKGKVLLIGYDLTAMNVRCLKDDSIDFLISQRPETQGYESVYTLYRHLILKEEVPADVELPLDIVVRENVDYYIKVAK
jgi:LacI family transcriptional regulator